MKNFKILSITKDVDSCWFDDALVRTCLVVAQKTSMQELNKKVGVKIRVDELSAKLIGEESLIEKLRVGSSKGYDAYLDLYISGMRTDQFCNGQAFYVHLLNYARLCL